MDWRERYERAAERYAAGESREADERQLVQLGNAAWAAGLCLLELGDREQAGDWLRRAAAAYRRSWDAGAPPDAWGRPIAVLKALLLAGEEHPSNRLLLAAEWALDAGAAAAESPIGRYAATLALLVLGREGEATALAATLGDGFPQDVAAALRALAAGDAVGYAAAAADVRRSFEQRDAFLEDVPVADTALVLDALAVRCGLL